MKHNALMGAMLGFFLGLALMNFSCWPVLRNRDVLLLEIIVGLFFALVGLLIGWIFDKR